MYMYVIRLMFIPNILESPYCPISIHSLLKLNSKLYFIFFAAWTGMKLIVLCTKDDAEAVK